MSNDNTFQYTYSALENQEVMNIRKKYLPRQESKLEELKRLDNLVQTSGTLESLGVGIGGCLIFGLGLCFSMKVFGDAMWLGIILGLIGTVAMLIAYPVNRKFFEKAKKEYVPRILELTSELSDEIS